MARILQLFFPQFFDPDSPLYVPPEVLTELIRIAEEARPWCLSEDRQNFAQAMYTAYLVEVRNDTSSGSSHVPVAGPITSEKEGDITVTYGVTQSGSNVQQSSKRPSSDPWDAWSRLWERCGRGSIITRYGDPAQSAIGVSSLLWQRAYNVWYPIW